MAPAAGSLVTVVAFSLSVMFHFSLCYLAPKLLITATVTPVSWAPLHKSVHKKHVVHFERRCFYLDILHHSTDVSYHTLPYYFKLKVGLFFTFFQTEN